MHLSNVIHRIYDVMGHVMVLLNQGSSVVDDTKYYTAAFPWHPMRPHCEPHGLKIIHKQVTPHLKLKVLMEPHCYTSSSAILSVMPLGWAVCVTNHYTAVIHLIV
jgi:hypothetical protein